MSNLNPVVLTTRLLPTMTQRKQRHCIVQILLFLFYFVIFDKNKSINKTKIMIRHGESALSLYLKVLIFYTMELYFVRLQTKYANARLLNVILFLKVSSTTRKTESRFGQKSLPCGRKCKW